MNTKLVMTMAAATLMLAGCSNDENESMDTWDGEIRLSSGVTVQTRANTNTQETRILNGEIVYAWADEADTDPVAEYIKAWKLTAGSENDFMGNTQYYPTNGKDLNLYALHGNFTTTFTENNTAFPTSAIVHSVEADQSNANMQDYAKSDLLYAIQKDITRSKDAVQLTFYHLLSKVEVALKSGDGNPDLTGATVTIENTKLKADFTPNKSVAMATQTDRAGMVTAAAADNNVASIKIPTAITTDNFGANTSYGEAVVVPQKIDKKSLFIKVTLKSGVTLSYKIPDAEDLTLESGKKYTYKITVNMGSLTVTSKIEEWDAVSKEGNATMDEVQP